MKEKRWVEFKGEVDSTSIPGKSIQQTTVIFICFRRSFISPFKTIKVAEIMTAGRDKY